MRIGLVRRGFSPTGGAEAYLLRCAEELRQAGHQPVLFASGAWPDWIGERIDLPGGSPGGFARAFTAARAAAGVDLVFSLERVPGCEVYRAGDGVHRCWLERRQAFEPAWRGWARKFSRKHRELLALEAQVFHGARRIIANSELVKREILANFGGAEERITVIYNGLPAALLAPPVTDRDAVRQRLGWAPGTFVGLFAGSGWERKGLQFALDGFAACQLPEAIFAVAGKGNSRRLRVPRGVQFLGPVNPLAAYLAAADLFVLPTIYDPFSNACLEALAAGLPVITTRANGFSEIMTPGDGIVLSQPDATEEIAAGIRSLRGQTEADRQARRARAGQFTIERNVAETLKLLE